MFRPIMLTIAVLLAGCATAATDIRRPGHLDPIVATATPMSRVDAESRELDRWIATCTADPMDFLDNREYCMRIGPWEGYRP